MKVDRVEWITYRNAAYKFHKQKPNRKTREAGIPQGGILSGLLANIYLHQFDKWVVEELGHEFSLRYIRYADDFIILTNNVSNLEEIKERCSTFLESIGLELHTDTKKTRIIDLTKKGNYVNFVGFSVSETGIRIKAQNIQRFKDRISAILNKTKLSSNRSLKVLKLKLDYKYLGNEMKQRVCKNCGKQEVTRNWLSFFLTISDVQQLRALDSWTRKEISKKYFLDTNNRLTREKSRKLNFLSLEKLYYHYRKNNSHDICLCSPLEAQFDNTKDPYTELFKY